LLGRRGIGRVVLQQDLGADAVHFGFVPTVLGGLQFGERIVQAPEPGIGLAGTRFDVGQGRFEVGQEPNITLLSNGGEAESHLGESRLFGTVGPLCPALKKYREAGPPGWEMVSRDDIGQRLAIGRDCFGVAPQKPQQRRAEERITHRRSVRCGLGIGERAVGKRQGLVDPTEHPQCEGVGNLRYDAGILTELVGEITMPCVVMELDGVLKMPMGAGKVAAIPASGAGNAVCDQGLGTIRPGRGFAQ